MKIKDEFEIDKEYRIVLLHPRSFGVLVTSYVDTASYLIRVRISGFARIAPQLLDGLKKDWGLQGIILDIFPERDQQGPWAVVKVFTETIPSCLRVVAIDTIVGSDLSESERPVVSKIQNGTAGNQFSWREWIEEAIEWVETVTQRRVASKLDISQYNAGGEFTLIRFPMKDGNAYWLKATGQSNSHELRITSLLARLCRDSVSEIIAVHPLWNAWLMPDLGRDVESVDDSAQRLRILELAVKQLAQLQLSTAGHEAELIAEGAFDQRVSRMRSTSEQLFDQIREAMCLQTSMKGLRLDETRLRRLHDIFVAACEVVEHSGIPVTVIHGDMNAGNVVFQKQQCRFIDWCEAYLGWPFVTLQHLLLLNRQESKQVKVATDRALIDRYCAILSDVSTVTELNRARACIPLLAAASALYGRGEWLKQPLKDAPQLQVYVRTMARHMDSAAQTQRLLETIGHKRAQYSRMKNCTEKLYVSKSA
ncbi:phosphotransferase [Silvibacterium sp.]|uniref:phosphotransferase n=1 Tax=Silvibacterium sp. TaxID=1964179 RepID=UPI0039E3BD05